MSMGEDSSAKEEIPVVKIDNLTRRRIIQPWKNCLIGKVVGKTVGYKYISIKTRELWNPSGKLDILDLGCDFYLFKFEFPDDYKHALLEGPWFVNGHHLAMMRWSTNFRPSESSINRTVVWARLPELPLEYYDEKVLTNVTTKLGKLIKIDKTTELVMRGKFARFCIEIDIQVALKSDVQIGPIKQKIEYEGINFICFNCGKINHKKDNCPLLQSGSATNVGSQPNVNDAGTEKEREGYGPWMLVSSKQSKVPVLGRKVGNVKVSVNVGEQGKSNMERADGQWQVVSNHKGKVYNTAKSGFDVGVA
ncbi:hypothetical protein MKX03_002291, partial [Papaver bracteatum]